MAMLILGIYLVTIVVIKYTLTRMLQHFWWESGECWQTQWEKLSSYYGENKFALFSLCAMVIPELSYWTYNVVLIFMDLTGKPSVFTRNRIQPENNYPVPWAKLQHVLITGFFNKFFISVPMFVFMYEFMTWQGNPCSKELPLFRWVLLELTIFAVIVEPTFYYFHSNTSAFASLFLNAAAVFMTGFLLISSWKLCSMLPNMVGPMLMGSHVVTIMLWNILALFVATASHCGYCLPILPSPEFHDFHHLN